MALAIFLTVAIGCVGAILTSRIATAPARRAQEQRQALISKVRATDAQLAAEHAKAKRQMNDAAKQSWRNLAG